MLLSLVSINMPKRKIRTGNNADNVAKTKELALSTLKAAGDNGMQVEVEDEVF